MKKFILVIAMLLSGVAANAQMSKDFTCFKLGSFEFRTMAYSMSKERGGGIMTCVTDDEDVAVQLTKFIDLNREEIEKKYGVIITVGPNCTDSYTNKKTNKTTYYISNNVEMTVFDAEAYRKWKAKEDRNERIRVQKKNEHLAEIQAMQKEILQGKNEE